LDTISTHKNKIAKNIKPVVKINDQKMSIAKQIKIVGWKKMEEKFFEKRFAALEGLKRGI